MNLVKNLEQNERYAAGPNACFSDAEAQVIGAELSQIKCDAVHLIPSAIVERAKDPENCLHRYFDWDDSIAATNWRKDQARTLVRGLRIVMMTDAGEVRPRAFLSVVSAIDPHDSKPPEHEYVSVRKVMEDPPLREQALEQALRELRQWAAKYQAIGLDELRPIFEAANRSLK